VKGLREQQQQQQEVVLVLLLKERVRIGRRWRVCNDQEQQEVMLMLMGLTVRPALMASCGRIHTQSLPSE
jgi:hypothetical protein